MRKLTIAVILLTLLLVIPAQAKLVSHSIPDIPDSELFTVWVNSQKIPTYQLKARWWKYSHCAFDFDKPVTIKIKFARSVKWVDIMPSILDIEHKSIDDYTFEFKLDKPRKITVIVNNDRGNTLHILTNKPEKKRPNPNGRNIVYYKAGIHDIGILDLKSNQTLYIESGARLKGMVRIKDAKNVKIAGRGIIDGSDNKTERNKPAANEPFRLIYMDHSKNIKIEGITLYNSLRWTVHPYACKNIEINNINIINQDFGSDGIDISACQNVTIRDSFLRTNDDCIVLKSLSLADNMYYPNPRTKNPDVKNILVERCTLWNMDYGNVFDIGFELRCDKVKDLVFRDCDVLMQEGRGAIFAIHNSDNATVENVLFENIRVENSNQARSHKLFDAAILFSYWSYDKFPDEERALKLRYNDAWGNLLPVLPGTEKFHAQHRGHIKNIRFKDIQIIDGKFPYSVINGYDEDHIVDGVTFENITVRGKKIKNIKDLKLFTKYAENIKIK